MYLAAQKTQVTEKAFRNMLSVNENEIICAPLESDTFSSDNYESIFVAAFAKWLTETEKE